MNPILPLTALIPAAGGGHGDGIDWFVMISLVTNAVLFFGFLAYKLRPLVSEGLKSRRENMASRLEEARAKQAEAERRLEEYQGKLDHLEQEVARIVTSYEKEGASDRARMQSDTEKAMERLRRETDFTISQEVKKAEKALREAAVAATLAAAEKILATHVTDDDKARLADEYIKDLEEAA